MGKNSKRSWFRFSLKTLLVLMTALAIWLGLYAKSFRDRRDAIAEVKLLDGSISLKYDGPAWLRRLVRDETYFWNPIAVRFTGPHRLTDIELQKIMKQLLSFQDLNYLMLANSQITNAGLEQLLPLRDNLETIDISGTDISDEGIVHLKRFSKLTLLRIQHTNVTPNGVVELQQSLPSCKILVD